ncbi:MAG TPA: amidase [Mesorhizobium sp.]|nr:amidase [Mesorhizobium sp.]
MIVSSDPFNAFLAPPPCLSPPEPKAGPLGGARLAVKDLFDVQGWRTGCGNPAKLAQSAIAERHAPAVARLLDAGAGLVGKTQTDELAFSLFGMNEHFPRPINPAAKDRITGGSSSGSAAAVSGGLADLALGTDTGGSVRAPASFCGILGLRPTHGRIPLDGVMPLAPSFDTVGLFARDAGVLEAGWAALSEDGAPAAEPRPIRLLRMAALEALVLPDAQPEWRRLLTRAAELLGEPKPVDLPVALDELYWSFRRLQAFEAWGVHGAWILGGDRKLSPSVAERFAFGRTIDEATAGFETDRRAAFRTTLTERLGPDGVLALPTAPGPAPLAASTADELGAYRERALKLLCLGGLSGLPQLSLPLGQVDGAPFGLSLVGPAGGERLLLSLGRRLLEESEGGAPWTR